MKYLQRFWKWILGILVIPVAFAAIGLLPEETPSITLENPQVISWQKPITDAEWAEDVKNEQLHFRSTEVLNTMLIAHTEKLKRVEIGMKETFECPECVRYRKRVQFEEEGLTGVELTQAIENAYQDELAGAYWEVEKLKQSVERMDNELRLRRTGFVIVPSEGGELLDSVEQKYVRSKIID